MRECIQVEVAGVGVDGWVSLVGVCGDRCVVWGRVVGCSSKTCRGG